VSLDQTLRAIRGGPAQTKHWALPLGRGHWRVLFANEQQPVLVPADTRDLGLVHHFAAGWKGLYAQALLRMSSAFPQAGLLPEFRKEEGGHGFFLDRRIYGPPSRALVRIGRSGSGQKASLLLVSEAGDGIALAKVAMVPAADAQLAAEANWLRELEAAPELEHQIPRLLAEGNAPNGRHYMVTSLAPATRNPRSFGPAHEAFLGALGRVAWDITNFPASPCFAGLESTLRGLEQHLSSGERTALHGGLHDCCAYLAGWSGPFVVAHRNFAPWNIRVHGERIFVLNWQHARAGSNPLADALNHFLMPRAVSGRVITRAALIATLRRVEQIAQNLYPEWTWRPQVISGLALAYLLEAILHCGAANRGLAGTHPVKAGYFRLMEERAAWAAR